ncbi:MULTISPECIES: soluble methane monooxygenase-binding protein MmoD [Methylosinus]|uniref:Soluble methane monooxygenase-binding protein MmoD n=2 Tax=Pseudomonadota TaxID=1224 RepID=A0A2D2D0X7_METT3|nr:MULTISPECIES: soluble methane monooxygenase-binding protein MmoD [Methylosinus]AAZ81978.1 protein D of soluble methane monooxygenase [Methylomonas sp. GYJ3]ATQ68604.1 soluble methane monooxygenase-binding protein MmoD [Methylosinus trichosporium OB3b]OBS51011.1 soluble methane monooxygenase-binding protein MmoD [Methylosinus sp. 3S-1]
MDQQTAQPEVRQTLIHADERYQAYTMDLEYMLRWEILRDGEFVQEGCSLSQESAREAVAHVLSHFRRQDATSQNDGGKSEAIRALLREIGTPEPLKDENGAAKPAHI